MKALLTAVFLFIMEFAFADLNVASEFERANIKPDILNEVPTGFIEVKYGDNIVNLGNELTPTKVKDIPEVHYDHEDGVLYTLVMTDPDVSPQDPNREVKHWIVGNIPGGSISQGEVLAEYVGSAPPQGTGLHRYVFLVYKQNQGAITFDETRLTARQRTERRGFSVQKFAEKYNLGAPLAGNYYKAQYDDYVGALRKQLGLSN